MSPQTTTRKTTAASTISYATSHPHPSNSRQASVSLPTLAERVDADQAEHQYVFHEITATEYLARTRRVFLYELDQTILDSVRATLTVHEALERGLLGEAA